MSSTVRGSVRILGKLRSEEGNGVVRVDDRFDTESEGRWEDLLPRYPEMAASVSH